MGFPPLVENTDLDATKVAAAGALVRAYCGWHIAPVIEETITLDGNGARSLILPTLNLVDLTALAVAGVTIDEPQWSRRGIIRHRTPDRFDAVTLTMRHGYEEVPAQVVSVVTGLVRAASLNVPTGIASKSLGEYSVTYTREASAVAAGALSGDYAAMLAPYRLPALA